VPGPDADPEPDPRPASALDRWRASLHDAAASPRHGVDRLADRLPPGWRTAGLVAVGLVVAGATVVAVLALVGSGGSPTRPPTSVAAGDRRAVGSDAPPSSAATGTTALPVAPVGLVVAVAGAVVAPGIVRLVDGARVTDALAAAGGAAGDADIDRLNLAATLHDGDRVYVPRRGEGDAPEVIAPNGGAAVGGATATTRPAPVDINRAGADQLDQLPGIGPSTAAAIVDYRNQHGPFRSLDDLAQVRGIGPAKLEQLRPLVRL
jgi:competence protein ComEA